MIKKIDHIGIAVENLETQLKFYTDVLGLTCSRIEEVPEQKVKVAMLQVGEVRIELLQPISGGSPITKFLEKRGEGIHHIAYLVTDLEGSLQRLEEQQVRLIDSFTCG